MRDKKIDGITELRDESDKDGMRVVIELRRGTLTDVVLNNLFKQTPMESVFGINMVALRDGQPRLLTLKEMLDAFLRHRREVVTRRTVYELRKARERGHVLEGQAVALGQYRPGHRSSSRHPSHPRWPKKHWSMPIWAPGDVTGMLSKAGDISTRPEGLAGDYGLTDKGYRLSPDQAQAILELAPASVDRP